MFENAEALISSRTFSVFSSVSDMTQQIEQGNCEAPADQITTIVSRIARDVTVDLSLLRELYVRLVIVALAHFTEIHRFHSIRDYFVLRFDFSGWLVFGN